MLQSIVGPPMVGATDLKSQPERSVERDFKESGSEASFGKALEEKITSNKPKEAKDSPPREMRQRDKDEKPQQAEAKKPEEVSKQPDGKINKKAIVRQKAIQEFMDSFESEFEISPARLVEAMAQLDDAQLAQSPEETASAVIDQLGLAPEDAEKAQEMYTSLLLQLNQLPQQLQPKPVAEMGFGAGMSLHQVQARVHAAQDKQSGLSASVDRVNKNFWMRQEPKDLPTAAMPSLDTGLAQRMMMEEPSEAQDILQEVPLEAPEVETPAVQAPPSSLPKLEELPPHLQGQMSETMSPSLLAALAAKRSAQQAGTSEEPVAEEASTLMDEFQKAALAPKQDKALISGEGVTAKSLTNASQEFFQNQSQGQSFMKQNSQESAVKAVLGDKEAATKGVEKGADFKQSLTGLEGLHGAPIKGESLRMDGALPMTPAAPAANATPAENDAAVKQLMNQAQYLIKKGGGEMKVQMTPEGMGTIHLKVMLQDGKVNLQMSADTQEAKKTIESSLAELKTSLAAHKLSMENVKVDVVSQTSADTAMQNQTNTNGQGQRDQARQFWNQFNENFGSQGRRESLMEMPNLKGYGNRSRDPLQPIETSSRARARSVEGKGSGLNLVA